MTASHLFSSDTAIMLAIQSALFAIGFLDHGDVFWIMAAGGLIFWPVPIYDLISRLRPMGKPSGRSPDQLGEVPPPD
jgi:hypothetical protein